MLRCKWLLAVGGWLVVFGAGSAKADNALGDRIKLLSTDKSVYGKVETISRNEVVVSQTSGNETIAVNDIALVEPAGDTRDMKEARADANKGDLDAALLALARVKPEEVSEPLAQDELAYMKVVYAAKQAILAQSAEQGDDEAQKQNPVEVAKQAWENLSNYLKDHPNTMHYYEANETLGNLLVAVGKQDAAATYFKEVGTAPWPDYQARAQLLLGRALQSQGKYDLALAAYDAVVRIGGKGPLAEAQVQEATIGRTYSLAGQGKADEAIQTLKEIIARADDENVGLLALAYNALGNCYRIQKDSQQAVWAYLHVDLEYGSAAEAHAEALANLASLWTELRRPDRARAARDNLQEHYPHSRWAKRGK